MNRLPAFLLPLFLALPLYAGGLPDGFWKITETMGQEGTTKTEWSFELVDDGSSTLIAVGRRVAKNGDPIKNDRSAAFLFIDIFDDGTFGGSLIESFGNGKQSELALDIDLSPDRQEINMAAFDSEGSIVSKFKGRWLGKGLETEMKAGTWEVREVVSPGNGSWDIEWKYQFKETGGKISGRGNKTIVNGRKAYSGESRTYCEMNLERLESNRLAVSGQGVETNHKGRKSRSEYEGWLSPTGRTFFVMSYESDGLAALFIGRFAG